jgi:hypothetical protein
VWVCAAGAGVHLCGSVLSEWVREGGKEVGDRGKGRGEGEEGLDEMIDIFQVPSTQC